MLREGFNAMSKSYLRFESDGTSESGKTLKFEVYSNVNDSYLGRIKWFSNWRRYVFTPPISCSSIFDSSCLKEITAFLDKLMEDRHANQ